MSLEHSPIRQKKRAPRTTEKLPGPPESLDQRLVGAEPQAFIDYRGLKEKKGIKYSKSQLWNLEKENKWPKRIYLSQVRVVWLESEIDQWIADRVADRDSKFARPETKRAP
jgi:prophage regulatory protein